MSARDDYPILADLSAGSGAWGGELNAALDEIDQMRAITSGEMTYKDLEMKIRDGAITMRTLSDNPESTASVAQRWLSAMVFHVLLGDDNEIPPNSRGWDILDPQAGSSMEFGMQAAGEFDQVRLFAEVVKPRGRSSREIRLNLEAKIAAAFAEIADDAEMHSNTKDRLYAILAHTPAPPRTENHD